MPAFLMPAAYGFTLPVVVLPLGAVACPVVSFG
jgi:hypothetical protein